MLTLDELLAQGWTIDLKLGVQTPRMYSLALVLIEDEVRVAHVSGIGPTRQDAITDAVAQANAWLAQRGEQRRRAAAADATLSRSQRGVPRRASRWDAPGSGPGSRLTAEELALIDDLTLPVKEVAQRTGRTAQAIASHRRRRHGPRR